MYLKIVMIILNFIKNLKNKLRGFKVKINELLLRKYIVYNQSLRVYNEIVAERYLEDGYNDDEVLRDDMKYILKKTQQIDEIEEELLKEINKNYNLPK